MTEQEKIALMKKIATRMFKYMRKVAEQEFRPVELNVGEFQSITLTAIAFVNANLVHWIKHMSENKTQSYFDTKLLENNLLRSIQLAFEDVAKSKSQITETLQ